MSARDGQHPAATGPADDPIGAGARRFVDMVKNDPTHVTETFRVTSQLVDKLHVRAKTRHFTLDYDDPPSIGGDDIGPGPAESTLAALGASLAQFYVLHGKLLGIRVDSVEVDVEGTLDLRGVFGTVPGAPPGYTTIRYTTRLGSPEPEERLRKLIEVVEATTPVLASFREPVAIEAKTEIVRP